MTGNVSPRSDEDGRKPSRLASVHSRGLGFPFFGVFLAISFLLMISHVQCASTRAQTSSLDHLGGSVAQGSSNAPTASTEATSHVMSRNLVGNENEVMPEHPVETSFYNRNLVYDEGFLLRFTVVVVLMVLVAIILVYLRNLKDRYALDQRYGSLKQDADEKSILASLHHGDEDDEDEISVFDASHHKLLSKERKFQH